MSVIERVSFVELIKTINSNFVDIYIGPYSPEEIKEKLANEFMRLKIYTGGEYVEWLGKVGYRTIALEDGANWVLRKSENKEAFVHVHPSRIPPLTVRVHGNAWKTVVGLLLMYPEYLTVPPDLAQANAFRRGFLNLSPVKGNENMKRVMSVYNLVVSKVF